MKRLLLTTTTFLTILLLQAQQKSVLFIGNSYTSGMPGVVKQIADNMGDDLYYESHNPGGARLMTHASNASVYTKINSRNWDYVSLQAQSQEPSWPLWQVEDEVFPYAKQLSDSIKANYHCSLPLFYMTWGRENGDAQNCDILPYLCTHEGMDDKLRERYTQMARDNNAVVSPAGKVWRSLRENHPTIQLYSGDGSHASTIGRYATAVTFYTMIFEKDPTQITFDGGIDKSTAQTIRETVKTVVFDQISTYFFGNSYPTADYTAYCTDPGFSCENTSNAQIGTNNTNVTYGPEWFNFTADSTTIYTIRTCAVTYSDAIISVYDDCDNRIAYNDDYQGGGGCTLLRLEAIKGQNYLIKVDAFSLEQERIFDFEIEYPLVDSSLVSDIEVVTDCKQAKEFSVGFHKVNFNQNGFGMFIATDSGTVTIASCGLTYTDTYLSIGHVPEVCGQWLSDEFAESDDDCGDCGDWVESSISHTMLEGDTILFKWWDEYGHDTFVYQISFDNGEEPFVEEEEEITSIQQVNSSFSIYPNPTSGLVNINSNNQESKEIFNVQGELILQTESNSIDLLDYPSGIYFIRQGSISQKIIKK